MIEENFADILNKLQQNLHFKIDEEAQEHTPNRLERMYLELLNGYTQNPEQILSKTFKASSNEMIIIKDIGFVSLCSHHWLPFIGTCNIGYIPKNQIVAGLSKFPRLVNCFAKRFQIQENLTSEIADAIMTYLNPEGCIVIVKASHLCAQIRGAESKNSTMVTSAIRGCFNHKEQREEFLKLTEG